MPVTTHRRPARAPAPAVDDRDLAPRPVPRLPVTETAGGSLLAALPALSGLGSVAYLFTGARTPVTWAAGAAMVLSSLAMGTGALVRGRGTTRRAADRARAGYARHLRGLRLAASDSAALMRQRERWLHPDPGLLTTLGTRLWERRREDPDFLLVRIGLGAVPLVDSPASEPDEDADPWALAAHDRHVATHAVAPDVPVTLDLRALPILRVDGPDAPAFVRALLVQAAALHSPADLAVAVPATSPWEWVGWLPHALDVRDEKHLLLVVDDSTPPPPRAGVTVLALGADDGSGAPCAHAADGRVTVRGAGVVLDARLDDVPAALAEAVARHLARHRPADETSASTDLPALLGVDEPRTADVAALRAGRAAVDLLRTPLGTAPDGAPVLLDIKESARGGVGPHGLVVGATGSGKSELLRTLVLGMAATHESSALNFVLVDFKGGATFAGLAGLPHVAATITNLEDDLSLVDRMHAALAGELVRRQQVLRDAGAVASVHEYAQRRPDLPPLPALWVVVDEFSELLTHKPELAELFGQLGRLGRSLGVHLLLASQRIDEGRLRGLEAHLSYRIALRTFSESESRAVLDAPDAYALPTAPGHGYLKTDGTGLRRFRVAYSAAPVHDGLAPDPVLVRRLDPPPQALDANASAPSVLDALVTRLAGHGPAAHRIWLPPLDAPQSLDALLPAASGPGLRVPVGTVDQPARQRREPHLLDLTDAHGAVVGGPRSGRSTVLRTVIAGLALQRTPAELQVYALDLGGGSLTALAGLPHVGAVAGRHEPELAHRLVDQISALVSGREAGVPDSYGEVLLVVDGWGALRQEWEQLEEQLTTLAGRSLAHGVRLLVSAGRWLDLRLGLRDLVAAKLELKLGDPLDSEVDRRAQERVPAGRPGRGVTSDGDHWLAALPRIDGRSTTDDLDAGVAALVDTVARAWDGPAAPPVRLLPGRVTLAELPPAAGHRVMLGVEARGLQPVALDARAGPGLVVLGDTGSGRTSLLRTLATQAVGRPRETKVVIVDHRRSLLGEFAGESMLGYCTSPEQTAQTVAGLVTGFTRRLPTAGTTPTELRDRSWWDGPDVLVLVDDHELVCTSAGDPLLPLAPFLPHARDVGLHLVLAGRASGRRLGEPLVAALRDLGAPSLVLSAPVEEGLLCGVRAAALPPGRGALVDRRAGAVRVQVALAS